MKGRTGSFQFKSCCFHAGHYDYSVKLADGHIALNNYVQQPVDLEYDPAFCVEYYGADGPHVAAEEEIRYLRALPGPSVRRLNGPGDIGPFVAGSRGR